MSRRVLRIIALLAMLAASFAALYKRRAHAQAGLDAWIDSSWLGNQLCVGECAAGMGPIDIPIQEPVELDFLEKQQIDELRRKAVLSQPQLIARYSSSALVYGRVVGRRPWWGLDGIYYHGPGRNSISGLSEESRSLVNPYLLVGVLERMVHLAPEPEVEEAYPRPVKLRFDAAKRTARADYDLSNYCRYEKKYGRESGAPRNVLLDMTLLNARDQGFNYFYLDEKKSANVKWLHDGPHCVEIPEFVHIGTGCGYPGGCNIRSPFQPERGLSIGAFPAQAAVKLWRARPASGSDAPDFVFYLLLDHCAL